DCRDSAQLRRSLRIPLSRQLQYEISAHGKPRQGKAGKVIALDQALRYRGNIAGQSGVIEHGSNALRAAAVALIHAHDIHACGQALLCDTQHVLCFAGALEPVDDDYGEGLGPVLLPITVAEDFYPGLNFDKPLFGMWQKDFPLEEKAAERLEMTSAKTTAGLERFAIDLRTRHELILNGYATERSVCFHSGVTYADLRVHL